MKIHFVLGTKAELIKMVGILKELDKRKIPYSFIHTGQHTKATVDLIKDFGIKFPHKWLTQRSNDLETPLEALTWAIKCVLKGRRSKLFKKGDLVVVHGDTESTLIGTILAKLYGCELVHIEGGLRSFDIFNPFAEEIIRRITDRFSSYVFCTSEWSCSNIIKEKLKTKIINIRANTVIDAISLATNKNRDLKIPKKKYAILMLHRKETLYVEEKLKKALKILKKITESIDTILILSKKSEYVLKKVGALEELKKNPKVLIKYYYDYPDFMHLVDKCEFIAADSGGLQEETYFLNKPYLILREKTERKEGLGANSLLSKMKIKNVDYFLENYSTLKRKDKIKFKSPSKITVDYLQKIIEK